MLRWAGTLNESNMSPNHINDFRIRDVDKNLSNWL